jgi:hypothetical protein
MSGLASQLVERRVDECLRAPEFLHRIHPRLERRKTPMCLRICEESFCSLRGAGLTAAVMWRPAVMTGSIIAQGGSIRFDL